MDYLSELNAFKDWSLINQPSTGQVALWHSLMFVYRLLDCPEWFSVPNQTLQLMTGLSRQGLDKVRNQLKQEGRIDYCKKQPNQAGRYHIMLFDSQKVGMTVDMVVDTTVDTVVGTKGARQETQPKNRKGEKPCGSKGDSESDDSAKNAKRTIYNNIINIFNSICISLPKVKIVTANREKTLKTRLKRYPDLETYKTLFKKAESSDFLSGRNGKWTNCNFDWLIKESNMVKVLEGNYDNNREQNPSATTPKKSNNQAELEAFIQDSIRDGWGG